MIRVLVVDDQSLIRQGLKVLLELEKDLEVIGESENGAKAIALLEQLATSASLPDVILMDVRMPVMDGVAAVQTIKEYYPQIKVLMLTTFDDEAYVKEALQQGAMGYLLKDTPSEELATAIRAIYKGYTQFGPGILQKIVAPVVAAPVLFKDLPSGFSELTDREREVLRLIASGASNREIAQLLYISEGTVKNHVTNILSRLGLRQRTQAAILANSFLHLL